MESSELITEMDMNVDVTNSDDKRRVYFESDAWLNFRMAAGRRNGKWKWWN